MERSAAFQDTEHHPDHWPTAEQLFFETGVILAVALSVIAATELLLSFLNIPRP